MYWSKLIGSRKMDENQLDDTTDIVRETSKIKLFNEPSVLESKIVRME